MAKFALECPKCGSINTASTFIFSKKIIQCGTCGEEIDVRQSRLTSKVCPHCGKVFVCDQAHVKGKKCPSCGEEIRVLAAATKGYEMVSVNCPQCACAIEVDKTKPNFFCPICDCEIDVAKEIAKSRLVSDTGVSVIQYEGDNSTFVWKHPIEDFNLGSQLVVHESQEAVFFLNGAALDTFGPGRHTLETENLPILKKFYALPTGSQTPFHAEVYFVNKTVQLGLKWGTDSRVRFLEPVTGIPLDIGASGEMNLQVSDSRKLLFQLVGTADGLKSKDILSASAKSGEQPEDADGGREGLSAQAEKGGRTQAALRGFFRAPLMTEIKTYLACVIKEQQINIFEIDAHMGALSEALRQRISPKFEEYGLAIPQFYITNILLPEEDGNFKDIRALISQAYIGVKKEEVQAGIAEAARQRRLVEEQTEAQLRMIRAQAEAETAKLKSLAEAEAAKARGLAEAEVMQAKGYSEKDVLAADVQKAYAEGMGKMGGSGGSASGGIAADWVGMMAGMKMAGHLFGQMEEVLSPPGGSPPTAAAAPAPGMPVSGMPSPVQCWACACGEAGNTKRFCMNCGAPKPSEKKADAEDTWACACGEAGNTKRFCMNCGAPKPSEKKADAEDTWACACGEAGNTKRFCMNCGAPKPE